MSRVERVVEAVLSFVVVGSVLVTTPAAADDASPATSSDQQPSKKKKRTKSAPRKPAPSTTKQWQRPKARTPDDTAASSPAASEELRTPPAATAGASPPEPLTPETRASTEATSSPLSSADRDTGISAPSSSMARSVGRELFTLEGGLGAGMRHFSYNDRRTTTLSPYRLNGSPVFALSGELYPFPLHGVFDVGLAGGYASAIGLSSASANAAAGTTASTSWWRFRVGPRARFRFGASDSTVLGVAVSYGAESFDIGQVNGATQNAVLPDVAYRFVRPSLDARVSFGRVSPFAEVGYAAILSAGSVIDRFPNASVGGVDAAVGLGYRLVDHVELRATLAYRRYFYALAPQPGDPYVAGGALDEMGDGKIALAWFM